MTREEAIENIKLIRFNAALTNANSFREALDMAIEALSQPSLPSNIEEAAEDYAWKEELPLFDGERLPLCLKPRINAFKVGAGWMANLVKQEYVGVAESPLKTFQRVNEFEDWVSYRH